LFVLEEKSLIFNLQVKNVGVQFFNQRIVFFNLSLLLNQLVLYILKFLVEIHTFRTFGLVRVVLSWKKVNFFEKAFIGIDELINLF
jgi:hypothetical protein